MGYGGSSAKYSVPFVASPSLDDCGDLPELLKNRLFSSLGLEQSANYTDWNTDALALLDANLCRA